MNNDFGWNRLPCSFLNENTVFLIITAMLKNFYDYFVAKVAVHFADIFPNTRLKRFIFRFITVAGKWVFSGRQWVLKLFTDKPYEMLLRQKKYILESYTRFYGLAMQKNTNSEFSISKIINALTNLANISTMIIRIFNGF